MFEARIGKALLVASAIAGLAFIAVPSSVEAASRAYCADYARAAADDYAPRRGLVGSVVALPLDVTGAVLTGRTTYGARWERAYNRAYADCRADRIAVVAPETRAFAVSPDVAVTVPDTEERGPCTFHKYHGSWDPTRC
jgi:hypothetical protein